MTKPPNSSLTGSQVVLVKKLKPYFCIAGQALMVSDAKIPINRHSVSKAAPLATQPKTTSAHGPERALFSEGGLVIARTDWVPEGLEEKSSFTSVFDMVILPCKSLLNPAEVIYLNATGLPAPSLISPQAFWMDATTAGGMGT